jgi:hypothetical protein
MSVKNHNSNRGEFNIGLYGNMKENLFSETTSIFEMRCTSMGVG